jgi:hypothetical protein
MQGPILADSDVSSELLRALQQRKLIAESLRKTKPVFAVSWTLMVLVNGHPTLPRASVCGFHGSSQAKTVDESHRFSNHLAAVLFIQDSKKV